MTKLLLVLFVLTLAGCASMPSGPSSDCSAPTTYQCQVDMYMRAGA